MTESQKLVGKSSVIDSGSVVLGPDDDSLTIVIQNLTFTIMVVNDPRAERLNPERRSPNQMLIKINTYQGGDLTFKFKVGTLHGRELYLAINLDIHANHRIIAYTFSTSRS